MGCLLKHPIFLAFQKGARVDAPLLLVRLYVAAGLQAPPLDRSVASERPHVLPGLRFDAAEKLLRAAPGNAALRRFSSVAGARGAHSRHRQDMRALRRSLSCTWLRVFRPARKSREPVRSIPDSR